MNTVINSLKEETGNLLLELRKFEVQAGAFLQQT